MSVTLTEFVVWLVVGLLAGSLAGLVVKMTKKGFGRITNLGIGMAGALIGGFLFDRLSIDLGLGDISISLQDIVSAFLGSLVFLAFLALGRGWYEERKGKPKGDADPG
jgi:uncharacterized membrane protein YeaQ/YmgE (transglycosylase-associated protein family)